MELLCCIVIFISLVSASPYGYNTKGGTTATADASAVAGTFGGPAPIPVSIPNGAGFSGSYSKSSSSSFASSSASSSSSSFSFSGTGSGLNTFKTNNEGALGGTGCGSGSCQLTGDHGIIGSTGLAASGANVQGYTGHNSANAASGSASANGAFISGNFGNQPSCSGSGCLNQATRCESGNCNDIEVNKKCTSEKCGSENGSATNTKCASGNCEPSISGVPLNGYNSNTACASGNCGSNTNAGISGNYNANSDKSSSYEANSKNIQQVSIGYNGSGTDCFKGNCQSPTSSNINGINLPDSYQNIQQPHQDSKCNSPDCNSRSPANYNALPGEIQQPATDLSPPSSEAICETGNCHTDYSVTDPKNLSTLGNLYNTGSFEISKTPHCINGECENTQLSGNPAPSSTFNCAFGNCGGSSSKPLSSNSAHPKVNLNSVCNTPNCAPNGVSSANNLNVQTQQSPLNTDNGAFNSFNNLPSFTSLGQSHTPPTTYLGCNTPNCLPQPSSISPGFVIPTEKTNIGCTTPNCATQPAFGIPVYNKPYTEIPLSCNTPNCSPNQLPPTSDLKIKVPLTVVPHTHTSSVPNDALHGSVLHGVPSNIHKDGCKTANCGDTSPTENLPPYTGGFGGPIGVLKPNELSPSSTVFSGTTSTLVHPDKNLPSYTGGFGAPAGLFQPIGYVPAPNPGTLGSSSVVKPSQSTTGTSNSERNNLVSGSSTNTKLIQTTNEKLPSHISGLGDTTGLSKPTEFGVGYSDVGSKSTINLGTTAYNSQTVSHLGSHSTNIADTSNYAESGINQAAGHVGIIGQIGDSTLKKPASSTNQDTKNIPTYTGGFHAPAGLFKPNDYNYSNSGNDNKITVGVVNEPCSLGNCGSQSTFGKRLEEGAVSKGSQTEAHVVSTADAIVYTGKFGGPPGFLKPYDDGKIGSPILSKKLSIGQHSKDSKVDIKDHSEVSLGGLTTSTGSFAAGGSTLTGGSSQANAGAVAGAFSGAYDGQDKLNSHPTTNVDNVKTSGGCGNDCGANSPLGGLQSVAAAGAQASAVAQASATAGAFSGGYGGLGIHGTQPTNGIPDGKSSGNCGQGCGATLPEAAYNSGLDPAHAKSVAGARAFGGFGSSYSSSSASAHASSGYSTKGGYGKR